MYQRILNWAKRRKEDEQLKRFGGIQTCPWCRQCAQDGDDWSFVSYSDDPMLDVLTCGVCGGTSLWHFTIGMMFIRSLNPPVPKDAKEKAVPESLVEIEPLPGNGLIPGNRVKSLGGVSVRPGLYRIWWKSGGSSLAAIGMSYDGSWWVAPTNWVAAAVLPLRDDEGRASWEDIASMDLIEK